VSQGKEATNVLSGNVSKGYPFISWYRAVKTSAATTRYGREHPATSVMNKVARTFKVERTRYL